jgi:anti-anti-sigma factor
MDFTVTRLGRFTVIRIKGEFTVRSLVPLRLKLEKLLDDQAEDIALDLKETRFVDSSAVGLIINLKKKLDLQNGFLCLFNVAPAVVEALKNANCFRFLTVFHTEKEFNEAAVV